MSDESVIPRRNVTDEIREKLEDNDLGGEIAPAYALGGTVTPRATVEPSPALVCPICALGECGHNLPKVPEQT